MAAHDFARYVSLQKLEGTGVRSTEIVDVAVIGLGAYGSAVLYQLALRGIDVVGIDRFRPPHAMGSSHGETRITRLAVGEGDAYAPVVRRSHEIWRALEAETRATLMLQTGGLIMAPQGSRAQHHGRGDFVRRSIDAARRFGIPHEVLPAAEIAARYPQFRLTGDELGYYEPGAGVLLPERCIETQLTLAARHGARLRCDERVLGVQQRGDTVEIATDAGAISASRCVVTAGPWISALLAPLRECAKVYRQTLHWFPPTDPGAFARDFPVFIWMHGDAEEDYFYGFPIVAGSSGLKIATESYARDVDPETVDRGVHPAESAAIFDAHVAGRLHGVGRDPLRAAACLYTVTPDAGFVVDALPEMDRVLAVSACSGHGFKHSAAMGEVIAERIASGRSRIDLAPFSAARFAGRLTPPSA